MATSIQMGQANGVAITLDLEELIETRLLITATSGGGKSGAIFQLCEQAVAHVQVIVIDPEGEFSPLRAKHPFVLVGPEGETPASVKTAPLLAHRLLKLGVSAICDLYEMPRMQRHEFVRNFLMAMVDAPKDLWHPVLVIVDEAHLFNPESGSGSSVAAELAIRIGDTLSLTDWVFQQAIEYKQHVQERQNAGVISRMVQ